MILVNMLYCTKSVTGRRWRDGKFDFLVYCVNFYYFKCGKGQEEACKQE